MRIVLAHKFLRLTGGTEQYFRNLEIILANRGHEVIPFSQDDPDNPSSPYRQFFLDPIDYRNPSRRYRIQNFARILGRTLYSLEAHDKMTRLARQVQPDLVHLQSIEHHMSPSILHTLDRLGIPMVQSVNTYKHVCASYRLYLLDRQEICTRCLYGKHFHAIGTRCVKGSLSASILAAVEMYLHQAVMKIYHLIDRFIVPNRFMEQHLRAAGYPKRKIAVLLNPLSLQDYEPSYEIGDFILYFGRIDPEKGLATVIRAMPRLPSNLRLVVVGNGSDELACRDLAKRLGLANVEFLGPRWGKELLPILGRCRLVVVPSEWFEPSPYVVYQAFAMGKPVIGSRIGGIPELITPDTGLTARPGDVDDWAAAIDSIAMDDRELKRMGHEARRWATEKLDVDSYYQKLRQVYDEAIQESRA